MITYVVSIVCTFDDVIVGCYDKKESALRRARKAFRSPGIRFLYDHIQSVNTEPVLVRVVPYNGSEAGIEAVWERHYGD